jgi:outer membrane protein OmpA-like peptidoglycan-associated protein
MSFQKQSSRAPAAQRRSTQAQGLAGPQPHGNAAMQDQLAALRAAATPTTLPFRDELEGSFGQDLGGVHAFTVPAPTMIAMGARAFAWEDEVFLDPDASRDTVAHEVAHVVQHQQGGAGVGQAGPQDATERDADDAAKAVKEGSTPEISAAPTRGLHGDWLDDVGETVGDVVGDAFDSRPDEARLDAQEELASFMGQSYDVSHFHPSTGRGNFDATYDPSAGALVISVGVHFAFRDGSENNPDWTAADVPAGAPAAFTEDQFRWSDDEKTAYAANTISAVQSHWSNRYSFHNTRAFWESLPTVNVRVVVNEVADADAAHYNLEIFKWPDARIDDAHIDVPGARTGAAHAGHAHGDGTDADHVGGAFNESGDGGITNPDVSHFERTTSTRGAYGAVDLANPGTIRFASGDDQVNAADRAELQNLGRTLGGPSMPPFPVEVIGHASTTGEEAENQALSEARATNVANEIVTGGPHRQPTTRGEGEAGATDDPTWQRVDVTIGSFEANQTTALHEFGHIFGLGDEYPSADGEAREVGKPVAHSDLAVAEGLSADPVLAHHSDSIMSNGEVVQPWHYATFMEVLASMTGTPGQWAAGPATAGRGDFPTPAPGGPVIA